jgi:accessory colonization factor AcfC
MGCKGRKTLLILSEVSFWTYPSSGVSRKNNIEKIKNYRQNIKTYIDQNTHVHKQITQGSITNHRATYLGAHT